MGTVRKRGDKWYIDYRDSGKRIIRVAGIRKKDAEAILTQLEVRKYDKKYGVKHLERCLTDELFRLYGEQKRKRVGPRTWEMYEAYLEFWKNKHTGQYFSPLSLIGTEHILNELHIQGLTAKTINNYLSVLKQVYRYAADLDLLIESPIEKIRRFKIDSRKPPRFFTYEEVEEILNYAKTFRDVFEILLYTGMRRNELRFLEWEDIDFQDRNIKIRNKEGFTTKTGKGRNIPMHPKVYDILVRLKKDSGFIFCYANGNPYHRNKWNDSLQRILKKLEIQNASLHTFRHTFASWLVMEGIDLTTVAALLGHTDIKTTMIYAHLAPEHIRNAINRLK